MDHKTRSVEHYRDYELVSEIESGAEGWRYAVHVLEHEGDNDHLRCKERSAKYFATDIEALRAAQIRGYELVDALITERQ
ncbi:MAG: hypothetical protein OEQ74_04920 [Gammaproteobacteria bacterium]|nr:hypothetical protein [Gammaproteobacteria bacterium]